MKPILILKVGQTLPAIQSRRGNFEDWFTAGLGMPVVIHDARVGVPESAQNYSGVVVTGSGSMVSQRLDWSEKAAAWLVGAVADAVPVLGVCYGHQLLAQAHGAVVGPNPRGREIGSKPLQLEPVCFDDPLLRCLNTPVYVQTSHEEAVLTLPPGAEILAATAQDPHHVLRFSKNVWGVQFHPEFDADIMRSYIDIRGDTLLAEGLDTSALLTEVRETPQAWGLLRQFARLLG